MTKPLCIYHANCSDGFASAFAIWLHKRDDCDYLPMHYNMLLDPQEIKDRKLIIVDFSFKRDVMIEIIESSQSVLVIDHHQTAQAELKDLDLIYPDQIELVFDMTQSGAVLTWKYFNPEQPVPDLFKLIQDSDLWKFEFSGTKDFVAGLRTYPFNFKFFEEIINPHSNMINDLKEKGRTINQFKRTQIEQIKKNMRLVNVMGFVVPCVNCSSDVISETLHDLSKDFPFAIAYQDTKDVRLWSLRSRDTGIDVSEIAKHYRGGGHKHAAGFHTNHEFLFSMRQTHLSTQTS